MYYIDHSA